MTDLCGVLTKKTTNKADLSIEKGISVFLLNELSSNESIRLRSNELHLISLAIDVPPIEILNKVYSNLKLKLTI